MTRFDPLYGKMATSDGIAGVQNYEVWYDLYDKNYLKGGLGKGSNKVDNIFEGSFHDMQKEIEKNCLTGGLGLGLGLLLKESGQHLRRQMS